MHLNPLGLGTSPGFASLRSENKLEKELSEIQALLRRRSGRKESQFASDDDAQDTLTSSQYLPNAHFMHPSSKIFKG